MRKLDRLIERGKQVNVLCFKVCYKVGFLGCVLEKQDIINLDTHLV